MAMNALQKVPRDDPAEGLRRFKEHAAQCIRNAYEVEHTRIRSATSGALSTSLAEDVFSLLRAEANVLANYIAGSGIGDASRTGACLFVDGIQHLFHALRQTQMSSRLLFLTTLEDSCAAATDFFRMAESMESFITEVSMMLPSLRDNSDLIESVLQDGNVLITLFSQDAVLAAERTQVFILRAVQATSIASDFFSRAWEDDWTRNEVSLSMVSIFDDFLIRTKRYLGNDYLYQKAVIMSAKALTCFYIRCLVNKADSVTRRRRNRERIGLPPGERQPFRSHSRALRRFRDDVRIFQDYFQEKSAGNSTLSRIFTNELYILELIHECLDTEDAEALASFIVVIHKRTGADALVTRYFVGDLWRLTKHKRSRSYIQNAVQQLQPDLQMVTSGMKELSACDDDELSFVRLDDMLKVLYEDRVAQGVLPACWPCLPKVETEGNEVVTKQIRKLTRIVVEMQWGKKATRNTAERQAMS